MRFVMAKDKDPRVSKVEDLMKAMESPTVSAEDLKQSGLHDVMPNLTAYGTPIEEPSTSDPSKSYADLGAEATTPPSPRDVVNPPRPRADTVFEQGSVAPESLPLTSSVAPSFDPATVATTPEERAFDEMLRSSGLGS